MPWRHERGEENQHSLCPPGVQNVTQETHGQMQSRHSPKQRWDGRPLGLLWEHVPGTEALVCVSVAWPGKRWR